VRNESGLAKSGSQFPGGGVKTISATVAGVQRVLITGTAGFIGFHVARRLLSDGVTVIGIDNLNDYYDVRLKEDRLAVLEGRPGFEFIRADIAGDEWHDHAGSLRPDTVLHLAAQAGVRYSLTNPHAYVHSNLLGFGSVLDFSKRVEAAHLVFASSSSVYGANAAVPYSVHQNVDHPVSLYAATKKSNELMAHTYSHLYRLPVTGLRFFTVYGPFGRPDMAYFSFTKSILAGEPINVFNYGRMKRDFTWIDDVVEGVVRVMRHPAQPNPDWDPAHPDPATSNAPYRVYNIGNHAPVGLLDFITALEKALGVKAEIRLQPMQPGDVVETFADVDDLRRDVGFAPATPLDEGLEQFVRWYREYYGVGRPAEVRVSGSSTG
jgi:UDP-glucuronate 4-epimerase